MSPITFTLAQTAQPDWQQAALASDLAVILVGRTGDDASALQLPDGLPQALASQITTQLAQRDFEGKSGEILPLGQPTGSAFRELLAVGLGTTDKLTAGQVQQLGQQLGKSLTPRQGQAHVLIGNLPQAMQAPFVLALLNSGYQFNDFKSKKSPPKLASVQLYGASAVPLDFLQAVHEGQSLARNLGNMPPNLCHPEYMAETAQQLAQTYPDQLSVDVLGMEQMVELGMNAFLAVAKGSERPGRLITLNYRGAGDDSAPVVLVGKGITFDTGGISIKPAAGMDEMKFDMSGAASVLGVMQALCRAKLPINVVGALACAENMPSGHASRPGDIVTTMDGKTVEILNTDAEGRLVLCDTLTYIRRFNPAVVVDVATLTGACVVALGKVVSGLFTPDNELAQELIDAGLQSHDRVWRMPVLEDYQELLDSPFADMGNIGGPTAGSVTAACFLARFTEGLRWAHLDIAGTANLSGPNKGSTGRPVPLLMQFLHNRLQPENQPN